MSNTDQNLFDSNGLPMLDTHTAPFNQSDFAIRLNLAVGGLPYRFSDLDVTKFPAVAQINNGWNVFQFFGWQFGSVFECPDISILPNGPVDLGTLSNGCSAIKALDPTGGANYFGKQGTIEEAAMLVDYVRYSVPSDGKP